MRATTAKKWTTSVRERCTSLSTALFINPFHHLFPSSAYVCAMLKCTCQAANFSVRLKRLMDRSKKARHPRFVSTNRLKNVTRLTIESNETKRSTRTGMWWIGRVIGDSRRASALSFRCYWWDHVALSILMGKPTLCRCQQFPQVDHLYAWTESVWNQGANKKCLDSERFNSSMKKRSLCELATTRYWVKENEFKALLFEDFERFNISIEFEN